MPAKTDKKRIVILDSHAILHRAYHALPEFSTSTGEPTGALFGVATMLLKTIDELEPDYIIAARDLPGGTFRHEQFDGYKATRGEIDDALISQLERAPDVFEAFGVPVYAAPGFEADDAIGTIVHELKGRDDVEIIIATGDMDALQLVSEQVEVFALRKGVNDTVLYDADAVRERYGFGPEHIVDYKALRGDPSDNIPGVKGIGEKGATELIQAFGSIEKLYATIDADESAVAAVGIKPRTIQLLKDGRESAVMSKELATIHHQVPIRFDLPDHPWRLADHADTAIALCDKLEFRSLRERIRRLADIEAVMNDAGEDAPQVAADAREVAETAVAVWLLNSDFANPTYDDILGFAKTRDFAEARETVFGRLRETGRLQEVYDRIECPLIDVVARMHESGIRVDTNRLAALSVEYAKELAAIAGRIYRHAGREFNISSPKQLGAILFDELHIGANSKQKKTATGTRTTKESELEKLSDEHPIIADVLAYRELSKLLSTYIEKLPALVASDGRVHAHFLQAGAATGRMASKDPNLQNIPVKTEYGRRIREAFTAEQGNVLVAIDYSQIELRIAAGLSGDKELVRIFTWGEDVHAATAARVFGVSPEDVTKEMRRRAKVINFGILYGMGVNALRVNLGNVSREEAASFLEGYLKSFAGVAKYLEDTKAFARAHGFVETLFGRRRYFPGYKSSMPGLIAQADRMAINAPMQGTQADIIKLAMVEAERVVDAHGWRGKVRLLVQVHDELVWEIPHEMVDEVVPVLKNVMESVVSADTLHGVPIVAEVSAGEDWGNMKRQAV
jgi:DNA polymerase-1